MASKLCLAAIVAFSIAVAGCGSSSKTSTPTTSSSSSTTSATTSSPASGAVKIGTEQSKYGTILEANNKTLYALSSDTATTSSCSSTCAKVWPPLTVTAVPSFGPGVSQARFSHLSRSDGSQQLSYGGHPLYWFVHDTAPGQTSGEGIHAFGGVWDVVSVAGQPVTAPSSGASTSGSTTTTSKSYGGY